MTTCPTPPTVIPSVGEGETGASVVQVPCAYPACAAVNIPSAPATIARNHFLRVQKRSNIFLSSFRSHWFVEKLALRPAHGKAIRRNAGPYREAGTLACIPAGWASLFSRGGRRIFGCEAR